MTEQEAWVYLADLIESPDAKWVVITTGIRKLGWSGAWCGGLCVMLTHLQWGDLITDATRIAMSERIRACSEAMGVSNPASYLWPRTQAGWAERAKFCRQCAEVAT